MATDYDWEGIADRHEFHQLLISKARFIAPATLFFIVYYFALPISVGYFPQFMAQKVWGQVNLAYLFALSQFFMAWAIAALYVRAAGRFDKQAHDLVEGAGLKPAPSRRALSEARRGHLKSGGHAKKPAKAKAKTKAKGKTKAKAKGGRA